MMEMNKLCRNVYGIPAQMAWGRPGSVRAGQRLPSPVGWRLKKLLQFQWRVSHKAMAATRLPLDTDRNAVGLGDKV